MRPIFSLLCRGEEYLSSIEEGRLRDVITFWTDNRSSLYIDRYTLHIPCLIIAHFLFAKCFILR